MSVLQYKECPYRNIMVWLHNDEYCSEAEYCALRLKRCNYNILEMKR